MLMGLLPVFVIRVLCCVPHLWLEEVSRKTKYLFHFSPTWKIQSNTVKCYLLVTASAVAFSWLR